VKWQQYPSPPPPPAKAVHSARIGCILYGMCEGSASAHFFAVASFISYIRC
jgi:hypothetical protein